MKMRRFVIAAAALLLSACGGETYPIAPEQAFQTLEGIGTPVGLSPMPGGLHEVGVRFEALPGDKAVQWLFSHDGDDLARIVAQVTPDGDAASNVRVAYVEGEADDDKWRNGQVKRLIQTQIWRVVNEAVDSKFDNRPLDATIAEDVQRQVAVASMSAMMDDVSASMDEHIAKEKFNKAQSEANSLRSTYSATKPSTDLSKFN